MSREGTRFDRVIVTLVIIAIVISSGTLFYIVSTTSQLASLAEIQALSKAIDELTTAERGLADVLKDLGADISDIEKRLSAVEKSLEQLRPPTRTLIMGVMGPMTGPCAASGKIIEGANALAIEDAKKRGLFPMMVDGELIDDVNVVLIDSESDPEKAVRAYENAIVREKVDVIVSGYHSSVAAAIFKISTKYGIIHIGHGGESITLCEERIKNPETSKYYFKGWPCADTYIPLYATAFDHLLKNGYWTPRNKKFAILVEDSDYGRGFGDAVKHSFTEIGFEVASYDVVALSPPETEFYPYITKYIEQDVSLVMFSCTPVMMEASYLKQSRELGLKALQVVHGITWTGEWYELAGEASDYVLEMMGAPVIYPEQKDLARRFEEKYGFTPGWNDMENTYSYTLWILEAIKNTGTLDPERLRDYLLATEFKGLWNTFKFQSENSPTPPHFQEPFVGPGCIMFPMRQFFGGEAYTIYPEEAKERNLEIPPWITP